MKANESSSNSSSTREGSLKEREADKPALSKRSETRRPKRGLSKSSEEGADSPIIDFDETPSLPKRKRRRVIQSRDLVNTGSLWISVVESLDVLYQAQENHQRIATTIVGKSQADFCAAGAPRFPKMQTP